MPKRQNSSISREIFALRREGELDRAYQLCRGHFGDFGALVNYPTQTSLDGAWEGWNCISSSAQARLISLSATRI